MSYWNYRVIRKHYKESDTNTYQIHEVYYKEDGAIEGWTESAVEPLGETPDELREDIRLMIIHNKLTRGIILNLWIVLQLLLIIFISFWVVIH
ncbi:MAG: hypothetical protein JRI62_10590 [Deltaproteobacteria bacterium]|nr:hypothetical protein [Deltaproteobacteria bacterium]